MKAKLIILTFIAAFCCFTAKAQQGDDITITPMRVVSFNVRLGVAKDGKNAWSKRCPAAGEMFKTIQPTVLGVQEAYDFQIKYLEENCPEYACVGVGREDGAHQGEHMSIFYRKQDVELLDWGTYWLSETPDIPSLGWDAACMRTATWALLKHKKSGKQFFYVNTHLDHVGHIARREGLKLLVERIGMMNPNGWPMILTGDFNVLPDDPCLKNLDAMMQSARTFARFSDTHGSFNDWGKAEESIDFIYYSAIRDCISFRVIRESFAGVKYISDHYPVVADIIL